MIRQRFSNIVSLRYLHGARPALKGPAPSLYRLAAPGRIALLVIATGTRPPGTGAQAMRRASRDVSRGSSSFNLAYFGVLQRIPDSSPRARTLEGSRRTLHSPRVTASPLRSIDRGFGGQSC
jgi:hypothetical protein